MHWGERMVWLCETRKPERWSLADLARVSGVSAKLLYKYRDGTVDNPGPERMKAICDALNVSEEFLRFGTEGTGPNFPKVIRLTMNELGTLRKEQPVTAVWDQMSYEYIPLKPGQKLSNRAFAVPVTDNACSPDYLAGDMVICEPVDGPLEPGKFVVAQTDELPQGVLRRFKPSSMTDMTTFTLVANAPFYPEITVDIDHPGQILGRVVKLIRDSD